MRKSIFLAFFVLTLVSLAFSANESRIFLNDGSSLDAEIISFADGKCKVKSSTRGTILIEESKIRTIRPLGQSADLSALNEAMPTDAASAQNEIQKLQPLIAGNPDVMKTIAGLMSNPEFQALLHDPEILKAAKTMDVKALMANQKFVNAMKNPAVKEIDKKLKGQ